MLLFLLQQWIWETPKRWMMDCAQAVKGSMPRFHLSHLNFSRYQTRLRRTTVWLHLTASLGCSSTPVNLSSFILVIIGIRWMTLRFVTAPLCFWHFVSFPHDIGGNWRTFYQERLRSHAQAFDGLLSLIPAKYYYGEDTSVRILFVFDSLYWIPPDVKYSTGPMAAQETDQDTGSRSQTGQIRPWFRQERQRCHGRECQEA